MRLEKLQLKWYPPELRIVYRRDSEVMEEESHFLQSSDLEKIVRRNKLLQSVDLSSVKTKIDWIFAKIQYGSLKEALNVRPHQLQVTSVNISKGSGDVASTSLDNTVFFTHDEKLVENIAKPFCTCFYNDFLAVGQLSGQVSVLNERRRVVYQQETYNGQPCLAIDLNANRVTFGLESGQCYVFDVHREKSFYKLASHQQEVVKIAHEGYDLYYTAGFDGRVFANDLRSIQGTGRSVGSLDSAKKAPELDFGEPVLNIKTNSYYNELLVQTLHRVCVFDQRMLNSPINEAVEKGDVSASDMGWDGRVAYCCDRRLHFMNTSNRYEKELSDTGQFIQFANAGKCQRVVCAAGGDLHVVDTGNDGRHQIIRGESHITGMKCDYRGRSCAVGRQDGSVQRYDFE